MMMLYIVLSPSGKSTPHGTLNKRTAIQKNRPGTMKPASASGIPATVSVPRRLTFTGFSTVTTDLCAPPLSFHWYRTVNNRLYSPTTISFSFVVTRLSLQLTEEFPGTSPNVTVLSANVPSQSAVERLTETGVFISTCTSLIGCEPGFESHMLTGTLPSSRMTERCRDTLTVGGAGGEAEGDGEGLLGRGSANNKSTSRQRADILILGLRGMSTKIGMRF